MIGGKYMNFTKMHGCGNDYIYMECFENLIDCPSETAIQLSDRHFGIGGDGLVLIQSSLAADFKMSMFNSDGSQGGMCGNAIMCVGKYVYEHGLIEKTEVRIETLAGIKTVYLRVKDGKVMEITVNMGMPVFSPKAIPVLSEKNIVSCEAILVNERKYNISCVSMGNPHGVIFVKNIKEVNVKEDGKQLEFHNMFPDRVNVEFVEIVDEDNIIMKVWERGTGETLACGTGACAAAAVGIMENKLSTHVNVQLPGGILNTEYDLNTGNIFLTGKATEVFWGEIKLGH